VFKKRIFHILKDDYQYWKYKSPHEIVHFSTFSFLSSLRSVQKQFRFIRPKPILTVHLILARRHGSRGTAEDTSAESKSLDETQTKTRTLRELVWHLQAAMRADGLNGLTIVTKLSPHESNPDHWTISMSPYQLATGW